MELAAIFVIVAVAELLWPRLELSDLTRRRWFGNLALLGLVFAIMAVAGRIPFIAAMLDDGPVASWGLLPRLGAPLWLEVPVAILLLDLFAYTLHRIYHAIGWLWRLHAVHHSDPELDLTTTWRQHPLSVLIQALAMAGAVTVMGISPLGFAVYRGCDAIVQALAHANLALPGWLSTALSRVLVTPDFHRLHHSPWVVETNSNYGQIFSVWDRLLGTARGRSGSDRRQPEFGLELFRDARAQRPDRMLAQPFLAQSGLAQSVVAPTPQATHSTSAEFETSGNSSR